MTICSTKTPRGTRYYADGKRISRALYVAIKGDHTLSCFVTKIRGDEVRQYCDATRNA